MMPTEHDEEFGRLVAKLGGCSQQVARRLLAADLINHRQVEALAIRERVFHYLRNGARSGDAMQWAAEEFHCSYEKVRHLYYLKPNRKSV